MWSNPTFELWDIPLTVYINGPMKPLILDYSPSLLNGRNGQPQDSSMDSSLEDVKFKYICRRWFRYGDVIWQFVSALISQNLLLL